MVILIVFTIPHSRKDKQMLIAFIVGTAWLGFGTLVALWNGITEFAIPAGIVTVAYATVMSLLIF
jgi:hypothetical protein